MDHFALRAALESGQLAGAALDVPDMRPGPVLAALTEQAAGDVSVLSDDELLGAASAARRLAARAEYLELKAIAEFGRRRWISGSAISPRSTSLTRPSTV